MKKRFLCLLIALLLLLAGSALAQDYTASGLFSISYDEAAYSLNSTEYLGDTQDNGLWLFIVYNTDAIFDVTIDLEPTLGNLSLVHPTKAQIEDHIYLVEEGYQDLDATLMQTLTLENGVVFNLFRLRDSYGIFYLAQTVVQGYAIDFKAYYADNRDGDTSLLTALGDLVSTFRPAP